MPKHAFKFPDDVVAAVKRHVAAAVNAISPERFRQEAQYTTALVSRLQGTVYEGREGWVSFDSTVFDDRGRNSAEHRYGADFAITATISDHQTTVRKAILVQAKLGRIDRLRKAEADFLRDQLQKMKALTPAPKIMQIPEANGLRTPEMVSGTRVLNDEPYVPMDLPDYFAARVLTTLDGCTKPQIVEAVQDSSLKRVNLIANVPSRDWEK